MPADQHDCMPDGFAVALCEEPGHILRLAAPVDEAVRRQISLGIDGVGDLDERVELVLADLPDVDLRHSRLQ